MQSGDHAVFSSKNTETIAVTGADGFIGQHLCAYLEQGGYEVRRIVRKAEGRGGSRLLVQDLSSSPELDDAFAGVDVVVHLAGRAHVLMETANNPEALFARDNIDAALRVARVAARSGVRRLIFMSSIGVNGGESGTRPYTESDEPAPVEPYAVSKLKAERHLRDLCEHLKIELVIVRPPLVYGPGAPGNFARLLRLADGSWPLPLGAVRNRRHIIGLENLCRFISVCIRHPAAKGELFVIAEPDAHSTPEILSEIRRAMGRHPRIFVVPVWILELCVRLVGRQREFRKLCGSLEVSSEKAHRILGWEPEVSFQSQIAQAVSIYRQVSHGE